MRKHDISCKELIRVKRQVYGIHLNSEEHIAYKESLEGCGLDLVFVRQVRGCALRVPAQSPFIPNPRRPSIASPAVTCFAVPACRQNCKGRTLPAYQRPVTSSVLPVTGLPRALALHVCIGDLRGQETRTACCVIIFFPKLYSKPTVFRCVLALKCRNSISAFM